jgi:hypothetical protein
MPFTPTDVEPATNSKVTVTFAGLLLLRQGPGNSLEIGIHKFSNSHSFEAILIINKPNRPPTLIRIVPGPLFSNFVMEVDPAPATGVQKFVASPDPFDRNHPNNNPLDYRWSFNLRSLPGHDQVDFNDGATPIATLNAGVLYTPNLTRAGLHPILTTGAVQTDLNRVGADLAASVPLPVGYQMKLNWSVLGENQPLVLPRDTDPPDTTYTISLINDPPALVRGPAGHDELKEYYKVLRIGNNPVLPALQARLDTARNQLTDEVPCLPVVVEPRN